MGEALSLFDRAPVSPLAVAPAAPALVGLDPDGLRPYQRDAVNAALAQLASCRSTLIVMSTGLGKTQTFGAIAKHWPGRVLVLAHRFELVDQAHKRLTAMAGGYVGVEQAGFWAGGERIVIGSVQTLVSARRRERFASDPFTLIVVDEAHHTNAKSYRSILEAFPGAKVLGVTATPDRGDGLALNEIYETVAYVRDIETGIDDGYLVPVAVDRVRLRKVDLSAVKTTAGDLNLGQLDHEMAKENEFIAQKCIELCGDRKTILFSTKVQNAHDLAEHLNKHGRERARAVDGEMDIDERKAVLRGHARGDFQYLVNVGIATEGYDCPEVACVAIARPTKSRALYTQMAGRGLRVLPGLVENVETAAERQARIAASPKGDCLLLDFFANSKRHALVSPLDILGGRYDEETIERAKKNTEKKGARVAEALAAAKAQIEAERAARRAAIRGLRANVDATVERVDPFSRDRGLADGPPLREHDQPATAPQREALEKFGLPAKSIPSSKAEASQLLNRLIARRKAGLASWKQQQVLTRAGISGDRMYARTASAVIDAIMANGWKPIPPAQVEAIVAQQQAER